MGTDQRKHGYRSEKAWVQIRESVGTDQRKRGYRSEKAWVQIRESMGTDQRKHGYRSENIRIYDGVEAETRKSQASFQIIQVSSEALPRMRLE